MDTLDRFRLADWDQRRRMLADSGVAAALARWLSPERLSELQGLAHGGASLAAGPRNLIVLPGITGSLLQSTGLGGIWWIDVLRARDKIDRLALAADGRHDLDPEAGIEACAIDLSYEALRAAIANSGSFGGSVQYAYDWRKSPLEAADGLRELVDKVYADYGKPVHLVGHSMGGLVIRCALMRHGATLWPKLGRIVFVGTPHYGAPVIASYLKNHLWGWDMMTVLGRLLSRETLRSMWGVLALLPSPAGTYPGTRNGAPHPCADFNLYDAAAYELALDAPATVRFQRGLDAARELHGALYDWHCHGLLYEQRQRMLQICGVGQKTLYRLETRAGGLPRLWRDAVKISGTEPGNPDRMGDGRVPVASAALENIEHRYVKGVHGALHNLPPVTRDILAWLAAKPLQLPRTAEGVAGSHLAASAGSPTPQIDGAANAEMYQEVPEEQASRILESATDGRLPGLDFVHLL